MKRNENTDSAKKTIEKLQNPNILLKTPSKTPSKATAPVPAPLPQNCENMNNEIQKLFKEFCKEPVLTQELKDKYKKQARELLLKYHQHKFPGYGNCNDDQKDQFNKIVQNKNINNVEEFKKNVCGNNTNRDPTQYIKLPITSTKKPLISGRPAPAPAPAAVPAPAPEQNKTNQNDSKYCDDFINNKIINNN